MPAAPAHPVAHHLPPRSPLRQVSLDEANASYSDAAPFLAHVPQPVFGPW